MHEELDELARAGLRPLRRSEYDKLVELGAFADEKIELLYGRLVPMSPIGTFHVYAVSQLAELLILALRGRARVRIQGPVAVSDVSEPEPDLAVVPLGDYLDDHPHTAHLVIEVSDSSLRKDRILKSRLYAEWGVAEYWLVNVEAGVVEVRRSPADGQYRELTELGRDGSVSLLAFPDVTLRVADFMPPAGARNKPGK